MVHPKQNPYGGHWPITVESAEYLMDRLAGLGERVGEIYEGPTRAGLETFKQQLEQFGDSLSDESEQTRSQVKDLIRRATQFQALTANRFLELQTEIKAIQDKFGQVKATAEAEAEQRAKQIILERWKLVVSVLLAFFTGLVGPLLVRLLGPKGP